MTPRTFAVLVLVATASTATAQPAQPPASALPVDEADKRCKAELDVRKVSEQDGMNCTALAADVIDRILIPRATPQAVKPDVNASQPTITDTPGSQVSPGQTAAVASGKPVASVGGSVAAVGATGQGLDLVTALAINPASIVTGDTSPTTVWLSRAGDLSLVLPLNVDPAQGVNKGFAYVGGRLRLDVVPLIRREWLTTQLAATQKAFVVVYKDKSNVLPEVTAALRAASDPAACAKALEAQKLEDEAAACKTTVDFTATDVDTKSARTALAAFREEADRAYLSVEARFDRGDLNGDHAGPKDTLMAAYLAGGYALKSSSNGSNFSLRGRGGAVFFEDGMTKTTKTAYYAAAGVELAVVRDLQRYALSAGFELYSKHVTDDPMLALEEKNSIRIGLAVPVADGRVVSVGLLIPTDSGDPTITVSGDWSLLLGND